MPYTNLASYYPPPICITLLSTQTLLWKGRIRHAKTNPHSERGKMAPFSTLRSFS